MGRHVRLNYDPPVLKKIGAVLGGFVVAFLTFLGSRYVYALATSTTFNETQWSAAGSWVSAIGALAIASVWLALQAQTAGTGGRRKGAEEDAKATQKRHDRELEKTEAWLGRQIKAEWYREPARAVAGIWETRCVQPDMTTQEVRLLLRLWGYSNMPNCATQPVPPAPWPRELSLNGDPAARCIAQRATNRPRWV